MPNALSNHQTYDTCTQASAEIDPERKNLRTKVGLRDVAITEVGVLKQNT